jgi:hypothetical protein
MARQTRRQKAASQIILITSLAAACAIAIDQQDYLLAFWTGSFVVATTCWTVAISFPVKCGVTTRQGYPCRNPSNGVLFGCSQAGHTWVKFRARFGRHETARRPRAVQSLQPASTNEASTRSVGVDETGRSNALFWLTVTATCAGTISMTTDVVGLFN